MLGAYPKAFRIEFGKEMQQVFRDRCRASAATHHLLGFAGLMLWDWLLSSVRERFGTPQSLGIGAPGRGLIKGWWLLALCGIIDAMHASINLLIIPLYMRPVIFLRSLSDAVWDMGLLALAAGACAIAAGLWSAGKEHSWLLSLHGLALAVYGAVIISFLGKGTLSFRPLSLLLTAMAASLGAFALKTARAQRRITRERWFPVAAGAASIAFAFSFTVVGFLRMIRLENTLLWSWMSSYFVLCAMFMLWLAFRVHSRGVRQSGQTGPLSPAPIPTHEIRP
jgi:uncharacterized membrane protein HdeD (DUF308 family)